MMIDQFPYTPHIIRENREILSSCQLEKMNDKLPIKINNFDSEKTKGYLNKKPKQLKVKWSDEEHNQFLEGLRMFGPRSKNLFFILFFFRS